MIALILPQLPESFTLSFANVSWNECYLNYCGLQIFIQKNAVIHSNELLN